MKTQMFLMFELLHVFVCTAVTTDDANSDCVTMTENLKDETCEIKEKIKDMTIKIVQQDGKFIKQDNDILQMQNEQYKLQCIFNDTLEKEMGSKLKKVNSDMDELGQKMTEIHLNFTEELQQHKASQERRNVYRDCQDVRNNGKPFSGVYTVHPYDEDIDLYCHMDTQGHGYMVFQHRYDGSVDFYRPWSDYKNGFGELSKEHWLGNEIIHDITSHGNYELRIDLEDFEGNRRYAVYSDFSISDEASNYTLSIGTYNGTAGDALSEHKNAMFSTKDKDNDNAKASCAVAYTGAWWYKKCHASNLNGIYINKKNAGGKFNKWWYWPGGETNMKRTLMMIRTQ